GVGGVVDEGLALRRVGEVGAKGLRPASVAAHRLGGRVGLVRRARIGEGNVDTAPRQLFSDDGADALAAGDEGDRVREGHNRSLTVWVSGSDGCLTPVRIRHTRGQTPI